MPIKTFQNSLRYPQNLVLCNFSNNPGNDSNDVATLLPYVDVQTGLKNRILTRDPIAGLGDLPPEINMLQGSNIQRKNIVKRNPVLHEGHLEEYDCLYTTKHVICKQRIIRDPITLNGDLGEEIDHLRPHGGRPRNKATNMTPKRDPIAGVGDFGREWDPIYKYDGRPKINRPVQGRTDPITHSIDPGENHVKGMRHFPEKQGGLDIIGHTDVNGVLEKGHGRKIFPEKLQCIDHLSHDFTVVQKTEDCGRQPTDVNTNNSIQSNQQTKQHRLASSSCETRAQVRAVLQERETVRKRSVMKRQGASVGTDRYKGARSQPIGQEPTARGAKCNRNPITHDTRVYERAATGLRPQLQPEENVPVHTARRPQHSDFTRNRNPITGAGMREEDYFTTINVPIGFWIRGTPAAKPKAKKPATAAAATENTKAVKAVKRPAAEAKS